MEGKEPAKKKPKIPKWLGFREDPYVYVKETNFILYYIRSIVLTATIYIFLK